MGNRSCYTNTRQRVRTTTSSAIGLRNTSPYASRMSQYHIFNYKTTTKRQHRFEISPLDIKQKHFPDLFLLPYYNTEILSHNLDSDQECIICFEPFCQQDTVARLECLCIYHKKCFDEWSQRKRCCPLHMDKTILINLNKLNSLNETMHKQEDNGLKK